MTAAEDFSLVICVDYAGYAASLELHKAYRVLSDKDAEFAADIRILDESGEDYLYQAECFVMADSVEQVMRETSRAAQNRGLTEEKLDELLREE